MKKSILFYFFALVAILAIVSGAGHLDLHSPFADTNTHPHILPTLGLMLAAVDATRNRAALQRVSAICAGLAACFKDQAREMIVNQDFIISEQVIQNNVSTYTFNLDNKTMVNMTPQRPLQKGVQNWDIFIALNARVLIDSREVASNGVPQSNVKPQTWPNPLSFDASGCTTDDLYSIYNSQWTLQVDRVIYIPGDTTRKFYDVPAYNTENTDGLSNYTKNVFDGHKYYELDPYPVISGQLDNQLTIKVPLYPGWNGAANNEQYANIENVITFEFSGLTVKNGAPYLPFFNGKLDVTNPQDTNGYQC